MATTEIGHDTAQMDLAAVRARLRACVREQLECSAAEDLRDATERVQGRTMEIRTERARRPSGPQEAALLGVLDHAEGGAVLHAASRVHVLELGVDGCGAGAIEGTQVKDRRFADEVEGRFVDLQPGHE